MAPLKVLSLKYDNNVLFIWNKERMTFLFQPQNGTSMILQDVEVASDKDISPRLEELLLRRGLLGGRMEQERRSIPSFFLIDMTNACNNRCLYCFRNLKQDRSIASDKLLDILNFIKINCHRNNVNRITFQPWGGEPLLQWDKIKKVQDFFNNEGIDIRILLETNGVAVTKRIAKEAFERNILMSISLDGPKIIHNKQRVLFDEGGSYDRSIQGLNILRDAGYGNNIGAVCVLTRFSIPYIEDIMSFFSEELKLHRVKSNIVKYSPYTHKKQLCLYPEEISDIYTRVVGRVLDINRRGIQFGESNLVNIFHNLLSRRKINFCNSRGCQAGYKMISFDMDGKIYPCDLTDHTEVSLGSVYDNKSLKELLEESKHSDFFNAKDIRNCKKCLWYFYCRGGCTSSCYFSKDMIDYSDCEKNRTLYNLAIDAMLSYPDMVEKITNGEIRLYCT